MLMAGVALPVSIALALFLPDLGAPGLFGVAFLAINRTAPR